MMQSRTLVIGCILFIVTCGFLLNCTPRQTNYRSGSLETARTLYSMSPEMIYDRPLTREKEKSKEDHELNIYKAILEQKFEFNPPVNILLMVPSRPMYGFWNYGRHAAHLDSFNIMILNELTEKLKNTGLVNEITLAASMFKTGSVDGLQEIAARYRADECLLLSYDLWLVRLSSCLGFWPVSSLKGNLNSEMMLIDTRTGFFLAGSRYSFSTKSSSDVLIQQNKELEVMQLIVADLTDAIIVDLLEFYESESSK